jgi:hypothetical protein
MIKITRGDSHKAAPGYSLQETSIMKVTKRKYIHETVYVIQGLYSGIWEDETEEETRKEGLARLKEYRENMPEYPHRMKIRTTKTPKETQK